MSTKCSIGLQGEYHFYLDVNDEFIWLNTPDYQRIKLMPLKVWQEMEKEIVDNFVKYKSGTWQKFDER